MSDLVLVCSSAREAAVPAAGGHSMASWGSLVSSAVVFSRLLEAGGSAPHRVSRAHLRAVLGPLEERVLGRCSKPKHH